MASTILLDTATNDLVIDAAGNIAVADAPYALAQDAASAIKTFLGEVWWDVTVGIDWFGEILGHNPPLALLKARLANAAKTVPDVATATVFLTSATDRGIVGQVQVTSISTGKTSAATFSVAQPQGIG